MSGWRSRSRRLLSFSLVIGAGCLTQCLLPEFEKSDQPQGLAPQGADDDQPSGDAGRSMTNGAGDAAPSSQSLEDAGEGPGGGNGNALNSDGGVAGLSGVGGAAGGGNVAGSGGAGALGGSGNGGGAEPGGGGTGGVLVPESCGDNAVQEGELCDDGNRSEDDACDNECRPLGCDEGCFCKDRRCSEMLRVAVGETHECALSVAGDVWCWGLNSSGQTGHSGFAEFEPAKLVPNIADVVSLDVGSSSSCAVTDAGEAWCWGSNADGQLGNGRAEAQTFNPVQVLTMDGAPLTGLSQTVAGRRHHCALRNSDGAVWCWGAGALGRLGNEDAEVQSTAAAGFAVPVAELAGASRLGAGDATTFARLATGWWSWGQGTSGQTGSGVSVSALEPVRLGGSFVRVDGGEQASCGIEGGLIYCWGSGGVMELETDTSPVPAPTLMNALAAADDVTVGFEHACLSREGAVECWGANGSNQLGDGSGNDSYDATVSTGITNAVQIDAATSETCALTSDHRVWCWGSEFGVRPQRIEPAN